MGSKRSNRSSRCLPILGCFFGLGALVGCDDSSGEERCEVDRLALQAESRFTFGETWWAPAPVGDCAGRSDLSWEVSSRPAGASAEVIAGADGVQRLTPDALGAWTLKLGATWVELTVIDPPPEAFVHYNYYPSSSLAEVDGALWVANPFDASITRVVDGEAVGRFEVGPWPVAIAWRPGLAHALVAQRGNDTVGWVEVASGRLVDAVWVGDEPSNLVLSEDGRTAWVALATEDSVAVVDVAARAVTQRIPVVKDPLAMALSGRTLWVASLRSGQPDRAPFGADPVEDERDLAAIDLDTLAVRYLNDVGHTITAILPAPDDRLYVAHTRGDTFADFVNPPAGRAAFRHELMLVEGQSGAVASAVDLGRQASSAGPVVGLRDLALFDGLLWVSSEGTDEVLGLDPTTLAEVTRLDAPGRPRDLAVMGEHLYAHGAQRWTLTQVDLDGATMAITTGAETRPALVSEGQRFFLGAGASYGVHWSCNTCHVDGGSDTLVWKAGPFESRHAPRPLFWLEATMPLGWDGYSASARNFAHTGPVNIGKKATAEEALALTAYLEALMPPPPANGRTRRDGAMSELALLGEAVFEEAGCTTCHGGPLTTNRALLDDGITEGPSDVPSLIGAYRHVAWLKHGDASTLGAAVEAAVEAFASPIDPDELALMTRYVEELTARDFILLSSTPSRGEPAAVERPIRLVFSAPVLSSADNLARITLRRDDALVPAEVSAEGRYVTVTPSAALAHDTSYTVAVEAGFEAFDTRRAAALEVRFDTAKAPTLTLAGDYRWVVDVPFPDFAAGRFDNSRTVAVTTPVVAAGGPNPTLTFDFGDGLVYSTEAVIDGDRLISRGVPVPAGTALGDSRGLEAAMVDLDADGVADEVSGALTLTGPGFAVEGVSFRFVRPPSTPGCPEGAGGDVAVSLTFDEAQRPIISWDGAEGNALALYVTDPGATLPLLPGQTVTDGAAYWAVSTTAFPAGFAGPVTYGVVPAAAEDASVVNGAPAGGAVLEAGRCYQFSVTSNQFQTGWFVARLGSAPRP